MRTRHGARKLGHLLPFLSIATCHPPSSSAFTGTHGLTQRLIRIAPIRSPIGSVSFSSAPFDAADSGAAVHAGRDDDLLEGSSSPWARHGLFISSFSDGVLNNPAALDYLKLGLARSLASEKARITEESVRESVLFSPCAGPNVDSLNALEKADRMISSINDDGGQNDGEWLDDIFQWICAGVETVQCRILYIPTAMYALNPGSKNSPGKQRQRARADGKKRRNVVVKALSNLLGKYAAIDILSCTLDLDDGSVKQPDGSNKPHDFPKDGREALLSWQPHLVYVEGGNTFWLAHCADKGDWGKDITEACTGSKAAVYVGKSAGAIWAGARVETAAWKVGFTPLNLYYYVKSSTLHFFWNLAPSVTNILLSSYLPASLLSPLRFNQDWDDPSVVPGMDTYDSWRDHPGLGFAGPNLSFFPHMSDDYKNLVTEKKELMGERDDAAFDVCCLRENCACLVDGEHLKWTLTEGEGDGSSMDW